MSQVSWFEVVMALRSILFQIYSTVLLLAIISMNIWVIIGKIHFIYGKLPLPSIVIDVVGSFILISNSILDCLFRNFIYRNKLSVFHTSLNETANFLCFTNHNNRQRIVKLLTHLTTFLTFGVNIYADVHDLGSTFFMYNLMGCFLMYRILLVALSVYDATNAIKDRLVLLSDKIETLVHFCNNTEHDNFIPQAADSFKCYFVLVESMDNVGEIYGWQILATYQFIVVFMVGTIYYSYQLVSMGVSDAMITLGNILSTTVLIVDLKQTSDTLYMSYFPGVWNLNFLLL
jgi:hypothetical protein